MRPVQAIKFVLGDDAVRPFNFDDFKAAVQGAVKAGRKLQDVIRDMQNCVLSRHCCRKQYCARGTTTPRCAQAV
jgi:hypothetical protein